MSILKMFFLVLLPILAFSVPSRAQESFPVIDVSLSNNTLGLTKSMTIECRAKAELSSTIATILSISIVHLNDDKSRFTEIASVSSFAGLWKNDDYGGTIVAAGLIEIIGVSYVNITLTNPKQENAGLYSCDLIGFGREGKITNVSASRKVDFISPTIEMAIKQIENYKKESDKMPQIIDSLISNYTNSMSTVLSQLQAEVTLLQNISQSDSNKLRLLEEQTVHRLEQITNATNAVRNSQEKTHGKVMNMANASKYEYFVGASDYFNGSRYWLSKKSIVNLSANQAQFACVYYGGYLAEIDSQDELQFTKKFITDRYRNLFWMIYVGGTDEDHEGMWINRYSKTAVASLWQNGEPNNMGGNENCQALPGDGVLHFFDIKCHYNIKNGPGIGFLCEI